jgi:hypothetical protein
LLHFSRKKIASAKIGKVSTPIPYNQHYSGPENKSYALGCKLVMVE